MSRTEIYCICVRLLYQSIRNMSGVTFSDSKWAESLGRCSSKNVVNRPKYADICETSKEDFSFETHVLFYLLLVDSKECQVTRTIQNPR